MEFFLDGRVVLHCGDCLDVLSALEENSIDSCVTDPPYHLTNVKSGKSNLERDDSNLQLPSNKKGGGTVSPYQKAASGFMGKQWDGGNIAFRPEVWRKVFRALKPGAHLLAFGGTRTYHRMVCAIEDAGFEIRDSIQWLYGSGFPKSHDVSKGIDRAGGHSWPAFAALLEHLIKKAGFNYTSFDQALGIPSAGSNSCYWIRTDERGGLPPRHYCETIRVLLNPPKSFMDLYDLAEREVIAIERRKNAPSGIVSCGRESADVEREISIPATDAARQWEGWGTALKPACEPIVLARKPLSEKTVAANVLKWGCGALNIDGCRVGDFDQASYVEMLKSDFANGRSGEPSANRRYSEEGSTNFAATPGPRGGSSNGRWPANVIHDGSAEVLAAFPEAGSNSGAPQASDGLVHRGDAFFGNGKTVDNRQWDNSRGSASRFFYTAKAGIDDRLGSKHPTVKPIDLMQYLVRLITPPNGTVLDLFAGTGTTGEAAFREGLNAVLIEREPEYQDDIRRRMSLVLSGPDERAREAIKGRMNGRPVDPGPLFAEPQKKIEAGEATA